MRHILLLVLLTFILSSCGDKNNSTDGAPQALGQNSTKEITKEIQGVTIIEKNSQLADKVSTYTPEYYLKEDTIDIDIKNLKEQILLLEMDKIPLLDGDGIPYTQEKYISYRKQISSYIEINSQGEEISNDFSVIEFDIYETGNEIENLKIDDYLSYGEYNEETNEFDEKSRSRAVAEKKMSEGKDMLLKQLTELKKELELIKNGGDVSEYLFTTRKPKGKLTALNNELKYLEDIKGEYPHILEFRSNILNLIEESSEEFKLEELMYIMNNVLGNDYTEDTILSITAAKKDSIIASFKSGEAKELNFDSKGILIHSKELHIPLILNEKDYYLGEDTYRKLLIGGTFNNYTLIDKEGILNYLGKYNQDESYLLSLTREILGNISDKVLFEIVGDTLLNRETINSRDFINKLIEKSKTSSIYFDLIHGSV